MKPQVLSLFFRKETDTLVSMVAKHLFQLKPKGLKLMHSKNWTKLVLIIGDDRIVVLSATIKSELIQINRLFLLTSHFKYMIYSIYSRISYTVYHMIGVQIIVTLHSFRFIFKQWRRRSIACEETKIVQTDFFARHLRPCTNCRNVVRIHVITANNQTVDSTSETFIKICFIYFICFIVWAWISDFVLKLSRGDCIEAFTRPKSVENLSG